MGFILSVKLDRNTAQPVIAVTSFFCMLFRIFCFIFNRECQ